ncbi:MAG: ABC transporter ATP-binding protein [bacterium]|nr:ABC transporter ATP-binding protein [bacterium]
MSDRIAQVRNLSRRFGRTQALDHVNVDLFPGYVYGLVGGNGQGKTTLIKHLLGLLKAQEGTVEVLGMDPVKQPVQVLQRIGYLSEERELPDWMRIRELLNYTAAFHSGWDAAYADELLATFGLDEQKKIRELSKGMRAQAGLIAAVAHRPQLLLLDEPSTGLDAIVRRDILNAIVRTVADEDRTVLFSSHLLDEVEQMSDFVFMVDAGRVVLQGELDTIKQSHRRWLIQFSEHRDSFPRLDGVLWAECNTSLWSVICNGSPQEFSSLIQAAGGRVREERAASLQEIYVARVGPGTTRPME